MAGWEWWEWEASNVAGGFPSYKSALTFSAPKINCSNSKGPLLFCKITGF